MLCESYVMEVVVSTVKSFSILDLATVSVFFSSCYCPCSSIVVELRPKCIYLYQ